MTPPPPPPPPRSGPPTSTDFSNLTSAISALNTTMAAGGRGGGGGGAGGGGTRSAVSGVVSSINELSKQLGNLGNKLEKFTNTLNKTQQDFGVSITAAAKLQVNALKDSVTGFVDFFKGIDFGQLFNELSGVMSNMADAAVESGKQLIAGNTEQAKSTITAGMKTAFTEFTKERPESKPIGPIPALPKERLAATKSLQDEFGVINTEVGGQIATFAKNTGLSVEQLVQARRTFATVALGDLSKVDQIQTKFFDQFTAKKMSPRMALEAITKYSELIARNGTRFSDSFARAAADAKKIGVDLNKVSQIGDNIINDFEGFLESQAELGAMGFNFDSSRLAEIAETGSDADLFNELRSQLAATGKDITKLRRSERLALESAYGINISDALKMAGLTPGGAEKTQEDYLEDNNSLLGKLLVLLAVGGPVFSMLGTGLNFIGKTLSAGGDLFNMVADLARWLSPTGWLALGLTALFAKFGFEFMKSWNDAEAARNAALEAARVGNFPKAQEQAQKSFEKETWWRALMYSAGAPAGGEGIPLQLWGAKEAAENNKQLRDQINKEYMSQLGSIGPRKQLNELTTDSYKFPSVSPREKTGERYNQQLINEAILRGQLLMLEQQQLSPVKPVNPLNSSIPPANNASAYDQLNNYIKSIVAPTNTPVKKANGGPISGPGTSTSDSIPARLSDGEYVINAKSASAAGNNLLNLINNVKDRKQLLSALTKVLMGTSESSFLMDSPGATKGMYDKYGNVIMRAQGGPVQKPGTQPKPTSGLLDKLKSFAPTNPISATIQQGEDIFGKLQIKSLDKIVGGFNKLAGFGEKLDSTVSKLTSPTGGLSKLTGIGNVINDKVDGYMKKFSGATAGIKKDLMGYVAKIPGVSSLMGGKSIKDTAVGFASKIPGLGGLLGGKGIKDTAMGFASKIPGLGGLMSGKSLTDTAMGFASKIPGLGGLLGGAGGKGGLAEKAMGFASKIPGLGSVANKIPGLGAITGALSGFKEGGLAGGLKSLAGAGAGKMIGGALGTLIPIPGVGTMLGSLAGGMIGKGLGKAVSGISGLFGRKKKSTTEAGEPRLPASKSLLERAKSVVGTGKSVSGVLNAPNTFAGKMATRLLGSKVGGVVKGALPTTGIGKLGSVGKMAQRVTGVKAPTVKSTGVKATPAPKISTMAGKPARPQVVEQKPATVDTSGIEQKLSNFINALQNIKINMDGTEVGKVLVNASDAAMTTGVFRAQTR